MAQRENQARNRAPWAAVALVLLTVVAHAGAFRAGFIWDDDDYVTENTALHDLHGLGRIWFELGAVPQYYPLVHTTFWIEHQLWDDHAAGYHAVNVLLHAANALLLWTIMRRLGLSGCWLAAAIFAVHPVHAESVAWITERKNVLSGLFYLSSLLAWLRFDDEEDRRAYLSSLALFACALLSKTVTATLPAAFLVIAWWRRGTLRRADILPTLPFFALGAAAGALTSWMERFYVGAVGGDWALSFVERFQVAGRAVWFYLGKLIWPHPLMFIYPRWRPATWGTAGFVWLIAAVATLAALWALRDRVGRGPLAAALFFGLTLGPALGFVNVYPMRFSYVADHFQYLASLGPIVLAAAWIARQSWRPVAAGVALAVLTILTWRQETIYASEETLWRKTIETDPNVFIAQNNVGGMLLNRGRGNEAEAYFRRAIAIEPTYPEAYDNLGIVLHDQGRIDDAIAEYRTAVRLDPRYPIVHNNLGIAVAEQGHLDEAIAEFREALRLKRPFAFPKAQLNLGIALLKQGKKDEAVAALREAVRVAPNDPEAANALRVAMR
ncbi:MAG TPA: tetratricopeptide repeat protein [Candidatus Polarisedimenticolaceae bacterium]|nr:tetratricopeptide repeat protein [Candidatus Polarisedimenticolaceae bacterium]